jgi:hypothetical protein
VVQRGKWVEVQHVVGDWLPRKTWSCQLCKKVLGFQDQLKHLTRQTCQPDLWTCPQGLQDECQLEHPPPRRGRVQDKFVLNLVSKG